MISRFTLAVIAAVSAVGTADARPNVTTPGNKQALLKTAAGCDPAESRIELDINNVRARLMTGGDMWWDIGTGVAQYEVPKGTGKNALFAGSVWIGGYTVDKQLKVAGQTYRQSGNDYWPGPLNGANAEISPVTCAEWDRFWRVDRATINKFLETARRGGNVKTQEFRTILEWPARGNGFNTVGLTNNNVDFKAKGNSGNVLNMDDRNYAPFVDVDGNGIYNPENLPNPDYPDIFGDQYIWWVFNDKGNIKNMSQTDPIEIEVQASAFAFTTKDFLNDATFYNYRLLNRGSTQMDSTYIATWTDADLGYYRDDYIGCDTARGLGILYNGLPQDGQGEPSSYNEDVPMVGVDFFRGPTKIYQVPGTNLMDTVQLKMEAFTYYNNDNDVRIGNPDNGIQMYFYMTGSGRNGQRFVNDYVADGVPTTALGSGPITKFVFTGEPNGNGPDRWSECLCRNPAADRRFIHSAGPFTLKPGDVNDVTIGAVWVASVGGCPNTSFSKIRVADDQAQALFDNNFETIEGPEAPRLVVRELNNKLVFYLVNDPISTNFQEKFGYEVDSAKYRVASAKAKNKGISDSLYKFEGYRVFQVRNANVQPAQIFDENGVVNESLAKEIFQTDVKNGISQIVNWERDITINNCDSCFRPIIKVNGKDSGIVHSFEVTTDAFASGQNTGLVNYKTYYFVAVAYAYNNFANFSPRFAEATQDIAYLESAKGAGGTAIPVVAAMPNPANGTITYTDVEFGDGVVIKRLEGTGNGGQVLNLSEESEAEALSSASNYRALNPVYDTGAGPLNIKVIDPLGIKPGNWELYIIHKDRKFEDVTAKDPDVFSDATKGVIPDSSRWMLVKDNGEDVIYSERTLDVVNEQILEQYGLSVKIAQVLRPGDDQVNGNGYITSNVTFADPALPWLAGVNDEEGRSFKNWIRSGGNADPVGGTDPPLCDFSDVEYDTAGQFYENMFANNSNTEGTWAPYSLGTHYISSICGFNTVKVGSTRPLYDIQSVDLVFTNDRSKWSRCIVLEANNEQDLAEGRAQQFAIRSHASWNGELDAQGKPIYGTTITTPGGATVKDTGYSYFPGYAINQETGERLNIVFTEDSYLASENGRDMIWNPTSKILDNLGNPIFGGRHYVYISNTRYDECDTLVRLIYHANPLRRIDAYKTFMWTGMPTLANGFSYLPLKDGLIPTETRLKFRVTRPFAKYTPSGVTLKNNGFPLYSFSTTELVPRKIGDQANPYTANNQELLDRIKVVPNPYYAYTGYEANRFDTRVRITNLPQKAKISIYSLDGTLIRRLSKDDPNVSYIDWDIRNHKNLPIASGMYLMHVEAEGIGETVLRWFGAMRPVDVVNY